MEKKQEKLPKAFKNKWVKALKSRKYKKGIGFLKTLDNTYCCLGVARAVIGENSKPGVCGYIPKDSKVPSLLKGEKSITEKLVTFNDGDLWTFGKIANWIEKNL